MVIIVVDITNSSERSYKESQILHRSNILCGLHTVPAPTDTTVHRRTNLLSLQYWAYAAVTQTDVALAQSLHNAE